MNKTDFENICNLYHKEGKDFNFVAFLMKSTGCNFVRAKLDIVKTAKPIYKHYLGTVVWNMLTVTEQLHIKKFDLGNFTLEDLPKGFKPHDPNDKRKHPHLISPYAASNVGRPSKWTTKTDSEKDKKQ